MRNQLCSAVRCLFALAFAVSFAAATTRGQSRDPRIITARAGGVNYVAGDVKLQTAGQSGWQRLTAKDDLKSGDLVQSGPSGRAEVLLNPGSYLRLGENSELELVDASLDTLRLKLYKGSAIIEATGVEDMNLALAVDTPQTTVTVVRRGIYRFNVTPAAVTEVIVEKGRALVGRDQAMVVKGGKVARVGAGGGVEIAKFDKRMRDALDLWSRERGEELARLNRNLRMRETRALLASADLSRLYGRYSSFAAYGVWVYNAAAGCYTFLPFHYAWNSPYGFGYGRYWGYSPLCGSCGRNNTWNNWPSDASSPGVKSYPPIIHNTPNPVSNPIPVQKGSSDGGGTFGGGKSKP